MNYADTQRARYEQATKGCVRAMTGDSGLSVIFEDVSVSDESLITLPRIALPNDPRELARHRGLVDSYIFMRCYHNASIHDQVAPRDEISERLYNLLERERFESLGAKRYRGASQNLANLWTASYTPELVSGFGGVEQLEWVISCLCREKLWPETLPEILPETQFKQIASLRAPIEALIDSHLETMAQTVHCQRQYRDAVLRLIGALGFNTEPAQAEHSAQSEPNDQGIADEDDASGPRSEEATSDDLAAEGADTSAATVDESHKPTGLVRNSDSERDQEPPFTDVEQDITLDQQRDIETSDDTLLGSTYSVFDSSTDEIIHALELVDPKELSVLKNKLDKSIEQYAHLVRKLAGSLHRFLMAQQQRHWLYEQDEGELDTRRLSRLIAQPMMPVSYRVETDAQVRSTAVSILVDNSRSMLGRPIELAAVCAELLTRTLEQCGVRSEVLGYTTVSMYGGASKTKWRSDGEPLHSGRLNSIRHIIYKPFATPWRRARERFSVMLKADLLKQNIDGEAIQWAHTRLLAQAEERRLLIIISDGAPSDAATLSANNKDILRRHLHDVIDDIESQSPVQLMGIGIGHDVRQYFQNAMTIHSADDLGATLLSGLKHMLARSTDH